MFCYNEIEYYHNKKTFTLKYLDQAIHEDGDKWKHIGDNTGDKSGPTMLDVQYVTNNNRYKRFKAAISGVVYLEVTQWEVTQALLAAVSKDDEVVRAKDVNCSDLDTAAIADPRKNWKLQLDILASRHQLQDGLVLVQVYKICMFSHSYIRYPL